jgi:hypothetical protein
MPVPLLFADYEQMLLLAIPGLSWAGNSDRRTKQNQGVADSFHKMAMILRLRFRVSGKILPITLDVACEINWLFMGGQRLHFVCNVL